MIDYRKSSEQLALDMINQTAGTMFRPRDIQFKNVTYLETGIRNTRVTLVPVPGSEYQDPVDITYDRINLAELFKFGPIKIIPAYQKRASDYLPVINDKYGLALNVNDIEDQDIHEEVPPFNIQIKIKESNPAFYGYLDILVTNEQRSIRRLVDGLDFVGIPYPTLDKSKIQGPMYFYDTDWSELADIFQLYPIGDIVDGHFIKNVNLNDTAIWISEPHLAPYNLYNARILYNGEIKMMDDPYSHREDKTHVLVIEPDKKYCKNISGYLTFHYNLNH